MNFTDVDDRTIAGAQKAGLGLREYTDRFIAAFREDARTLGLEEVEESPRATDEANLRAMTDLITALDRNGHTYRSDGSIYFKIATFEDYGKLAKLDHAGIQPGASTRTHTPDVPRISCCEHAPTADVGLARGLGSRKWHQCSAMRAVARRASHRPARRGPRFPPGKIISERLKQPFSRFWVHVGTC
jgi:cysteinyl-tRNA synthetase